MLSLADFPSSYNNTLLRAVDSAGDYFLASLGGSGPGDTQVEIERVNSSGVADSVVVDNVNYSGTTLGEQIVVDSKGAIYVPMNSGILKIASDVASVFVGNVSSGGSNNGDSDGTGTSASFIAPVYLAIDSSDNIYAYDAGNADIRKITPAGAVTHVAGASTGATFNAIQGIAVDASGNVFVTDVAAFGLSNQSIIRMVTPAGEVSTFCWNALSFGDESSCGGRLNGYLLGDIAVDPTTGNVFVDAYLSGSSLGSGDVILKITP